MQVVCTCNYNADPHIPGWATLRILRERYKILILRERYNTCTVKPLYKDHSREPENVSFMSSWPLYTG